MGSMIRIAPSFPKCQTSPKSVLATVSTGRGGGGGGTLTALGGELSQQQSVLASVNSSGMRSGMGVIASINGPGQAIVTSPGCNTPRRIKTANLRDTYARGTQVLIGEGAGDPGEVILGLPPNCQSGASQVPPINISSNKDYTIPVACPKMITGRRYLVVATDSVLENGFVTWQAHEYEDGKHIRMIGDIELPFSSGDFDGGQRIRNDWLEKEFIMHYDGPDLPTGDLTFAGSNPGAIARTTGTWEDEYIGAGMLITISGSVSNDGEYTVTGVTGATITVAQATAAEGPVAATASVSGSFEGVAPVEDDHDLVVLRFRYAGPFMREIGVITWDVQGGRVWRRNLGELHTKNIVGIENAGLCAAAVRVGFPGRLHALPPTICFVAADYNRDAPQSLLENPLPPGNDLHQVHVHQFTAFPANAILRQSSSGSGGGGDMNHSYCEPADSTSVWGVSSSPNADGAPDLFVGNDWLAFVLHLFNSDSNETEHWWFHTARGLFVDDPPTGETVIEAEWNRSITATQGKRVETYRTVGFGQVSGRQLNTIPLDDGRCFSYDEVHGPFAYDINGNFFDYWQSGVHKPNWDLGVFGDDFPRTIDVSRDQKTWCAFGAVHFEGLNLTCLSLRGQVDGSCSIPYIPVENPPDTGFVVEAMWFREIGDPPWA